MKSRTFTTIVEQYHKAWLSRSLALQTGNAGDIDLLDSGYGSKIGVELKCRYSVWSMRIAVHHEQVAKFREKHPNHQLFWAFLFYDLTQPPKDIPSSADVEAFIYRRQVWCLPWSWMDQFPVCHPPTGPYQYVTRNDFPNGDYFARFRRHQGTVFAPKKSVLTQRLSDKQQLQKLEETLDIPF